MSKCKNCYKNKREKKSMRCEECNRKEYQRDEETVKEAIEIGKEYRRAVIMGWV